jgi:hypothetical protein
VGVLVGVEVGGGDASVLQALDLREGFAGDVIFADLAAKYGEVEVYERAAECFAVGGEQRGDVFGRRDWCAVGEDDVAADA